MSTVTRYLVEHDIRFLALDHRRAQTADAEARALSMPTDRVAKTVVLRTPSGFVLGVIPASEKIDLIRAGEAVGAPVELASEREIAAAFPGYELGATPPIGQLLGVRVFVDEQLVAQKFVTFASGRQVESVMVSPADLLKDPMTVVVALCEPHRIYDGYWME